MDISLVVGVRGMDRKSDIELVRLSFRFCRLSVYVCKIIYILIEAAHHAKSGKRVGLDPRYSAHVCDFIYVTIRRERILSRLKRCSISSGRRINSWVLCMCCRVDVATLHKVD